MTPAAQPSPPPAGEPHPEGQVRSAAAQEIEYAPAVMETIRAEAVSGLLRLGRGGIEIGGLLFGRNTPEAVRILAVRPLDCEHRFGPSFVMSDRDEDRLRLMLQPEHRDDETRELDPVGWYVSHCRRKFSLDDSDVRIFDRYFPSAGSVTLIVMPEKIKPTRACFFIRDPKTQMKPDVPSCEVLLPSPVDMALSGPSVALTPTVAPPHDQSMSMALAPLHTAVATSDTREIAARRLQTFINQQEKHRKISTWNLWATMAVLLLCLVGAGYLWMRSNDSEPPAIPLRVSDSGAQIRIQWDTKLRSVESASSGVLELREADGSAENVILQPNVLRTGSAFYTRRTDKVEIRLKLLYPDRPAFESVVYFIHPIQTANAAQPPDSATAPAGLPATAQPVPTASAPQSAAPAPESTKPVDAKPAEVKPPEPKPAGPKAKTERELKAEAKKEAKPEEKPEKKTERPRTFRPPVTPPRTVASNVAPATLPTPTGTPNFQPPSVNLPNQPVIAPPPPAPAPVAPVAAAKKEPARPRSGRLIWTGELGRNGLLTLNSAGASLGWTNGRLPGGPVRVSVHVAQLVAGGMEVYTDDSKRADSAEAPNAENGWNTVLYKADAKKLGADVQIIEAPSAANSWGQLVLRNGKRPVSVLVIDWQLN